MPRTTEPNDKAITLLDDCKGPSLDHRDAFNRAVRDWLVHAGYPSGHETGGSDDIPHFDRHFDSRHHSPQADLARGLRRDCVTATGREKKSARGQGGTYGCPSAFALCIYGVLPMKAVLAFAATAALIVCSQVAYAQSATPEGAVTGMKPDRTTASTATRREMHVKEASLRQKRADCRKQARAQKVPLLKRHAFVEHCTGG